MVQSMKGDSLSWQTAAAAWACICTVCSRAPVPRLALPAPRPAPQKCAADPTHPAPFCTVCSRFPHTLRAYVATELSCSRVMPRPLSESISPMRASSIFEPSWKSLLVSSGACTSLPTDTWDWSRMGPVIRGACVKGQEEQEG